MSSPRRVFLHIGSPKTGTTFLQGVLWQQREVAVAQGLLLPGSRFFDHFLATLDVRGLAGQPGQPAAAEGAWQRLVEEVTATPGPSLISHELFAGATQRQAARAMTAFGDDVEVHLVLSVRDLPRQLTAEWQEHVKHRDTRSLAEFCDVVRRDEERTTWFWRVQDYARLLRWWGGGLTPDRLHVVTVPPPGSAPGLLWGRFCDVLGIDPAAFDLDAAPRANTSLGYEQVELLRRVNALLPESVGIPGTYPRIVKEVFAQQILPSRRGTSLRLDDETFDFAREASQRAAAALSELGPHVAGDLGDLVPPERDRSRPGLGVPSDAALLEESLHANAELLSALSERLPQEAAFTALQQQARRAPLRFVLREASERHPRINGVRHRFHAVRRRVTGATEDD